MSSLEHIGASNPKKKMTHDCLRGIFFDISLKGGELGFKSLKMVLL